MIKIDWKNEKIKVIVFFLVATVILTWPVAWGFFSSVASSGSDTMQVIGVSGSQANLLTDRGIFKGTLELIKNSEFNLLTVYAYFRLVFGRVPGYNLLFFFSYIASGFGAYLLAYYFTKNKPASLLAGFVFAFAPFHVHNSISTNVGTMHQEWLPFFALYLFKFFDDLKLKNFAYSGIFLALIGFTEHQLLAFTAIFVLFFLIYKLVVDPKIFLRGKLWAYVLASLAVFSPLFFWMFRSLFKIATSANNYLNPGFKSAVKYSNDALSIFVTPSFHSLWPDAFSRVKSQFERSSDSTFSVYAGYVVLLLFVVGVFFLVRNFLRKKKKGMGEREENAAPGKGFVFWTVVAIGFYVLSLGPYLHWRGLVDPPVKMPYILFYDYFPFYENIRTTGRLFVYSSLAFSLLAAWGMAFLDQFFRERKKTKDGKREENVETLSPVRALLTRPLFAVAGILITVDFLSMPLKVDSLKHSPFYEKLGKDKENYSVLEVPGSTDYDFASRDLVWKSIHRKNTINGYDFARVAKEHYTFQRGTPIIRTLLYDLTSESNGNDRDIMKDSYYDISNQILNYYNIRYVILDKEGLKGDPEKGDPNMFYPAKAYIASVIKCAEEYEDEYLYACAINSDSKPESTFLAMDYTNSHWMGKSKSKNGLQRWAENGAGLKLVNMSGANKEGKLSFNLKISKPLGIKIFLNGQEAYSRYLTNIGNKMSVEVPLGNINPGENDVTFGVYGADGMEIRSDKKADTARIYQVRIE